MKNNTFFFYFFLFPLSAEDLLFAPTKSKQKIGAGTFGQQLVIRQFLKIVAVVICELIALTPKITHQQREMICAILRQFFQNFETICNPSLYGVLAHGKLCGTEKRLPCLKGAGFAKGKD